MKLILSMSQSPQAGQFNSYWVGKSLKDQMELSLNPLKRVNSILTIRLEQSNYSSLQSQSPQAGQFNSYGSEQRRNQ